MAHNVLESHLQCAILIHGQSYKMYKGLLFSFSHSGFPLNGSLAPFSSQLLDLAMISLFKN